MKGLIFIYLVSYGGSFFALFNPFIGLCAYYIFAILRPQSLWEWALTGSNYNEPFSKYLALATIIGFVIVFFKERRPSLPGRRSPISSKLPILGGSFSIVILFMIAILANISIWFIEKGGFVDHEFPSSLMKIAVMLLIGYYVIDTRARINAFLWVIFLSQFYLTLEINAYYFVQGYNFILWQDGFGSLNNNGFAMSLLPCMGLALLVGLHEPRPALKWMALLCAVSSFHVILLAESRGSYLGVIVIASVACGLMKWNFKALGIFILITVLGIALVGDSVIKEFGTIFVGEGERDHSAESRFDLWAMAFKVMMDSPYIGIGPGQFNDYYWTFHGGDVNTWKSPHNAFLRVGAECGIFAFILLIIFYASVILRCMRELRYNKGRRGDSDPGVTGIVGGVLAGVLGFIAASIFSDGTAIDATYAVILPVLSLFRIQFHSRKQVGEEKIPFAQMGYAPG